MKRWAAHGLIHSRSHFLHSRAECANLLSVHSHINIINEQYVICLHRKTCKLIKIYNTYIIYLKIQSSNIYNNNMESKTTEKESAWNIFVKQYKMDYDIHTYSVFFSSSLHTFFFFYFSSLWFCYHRHRYAQKTRAHIHSTN